jgi:hypothetical protein
MKERPSRSSLAVALLLAASNNFERRLSWALNGPCSCSAMQQACTGCCLSSSL